VPTYQYQCSECYGEFEEFQKMSDPPLDTCPKCGGRARRIISGGAGFLLKGTGFYTTDYRSDSYNKAADKEKLADKPSAEKPKKGDKKKPPKKE
jgi:putative FmdB family regulatory protein